MCKKLTPTEKRVLKYMKDGSTNKEIADSMFVDQSNNLKVLMKLARKGKIRQVYKNGRLEYYKRKTND